MTCEGIVDFIVTTMGTFSHVPIRQCGLCSFTNSICNTPVLVRLSARQIRKFCARQIRRFVVIRPKISIHDHVLRVQIVKESVREMFGPDGRGTTVVRVQNGWFKIRIRSIDVGKCQPSFAIRGGT
jgi:hypothetical protein